MKQSCENNGQNTFTLILVHPSIDANAEISNSCIHQTLANNFDVKYTVGKHSTRS